MSNMAFEVNPYAVLFGQLDDKIAREFYMRKYPQTETYFKQVGQKDTDWDKRLNEFIRENPNLFKNRKIVRGGYNIFRDFTTHSPRANSDDFSITLKNLMVYGCDVSEKELDEIGNILPRFQSLMQTEEFKTILDETKSYKNKVEKNWRETERAIDSYALEILGIDMYASKRKVVTYVMPPISENQRNNPMEQDKTYFFWSQPIKRKNNSEAYGITSLAHEKLHHLLPYKPIMSAEDKKKHHAFIKFVANKELFSRITGKSYLENDSKNENGEIMGQIYPYWLGYLHRKDKNPAEAIQKDIERDKAIFNEIKPNSKKKKLYSGYNFERLSAEKIAKFFRYKKGITPYEFNKVEFSNLDNVYKDEYLIERKTENETLEDR